MTPVKAKVIYSDRMRGNMKIKLEINPKYQELEIHVCHEADTEQAREACRVIRSALDTSVMAYSDGQVIPIGSSDIIRIFAQNQGVYVTTAGGVYRLRERLYELEEKLDTSRFLRISNSEIVNLRKIQRMDTSLTGTVKMYLDENIETYVSRRYVTRIKKALGI